MHLSHDGRVVVFHDHDLGRLTDGAGKVFDHDWAELRRLDAAYGFGAADGFPHRGTGVTIPLLEEVAATFPDCLFNIDLKQAAIAEPVAAEIVRTGLEERVLIGSFHDRRIRAFRRAAPDVATSAGPIEVAAFLLRRGGHADAYQVPEKAGGWRIVSSRFVRRAHEAGKQVHVWTVDDKPTMRRLLDLGVDGIVTDRPDLLNEVVFGTSD